MIDSLLLCFYALIIVEEGPGSILSDLILRKGFTKNLINIIRNFIIIIIVFYVKRLGALPPPPGKG